MTHNILDLTEDVYMRLRPVVCRKCDLKVSITTGVSSAKVFSVTTTVMIVSDPRSFRTITRASEIPLDHPDKEIASKVKAQLSSIYKELTI